jgi:hypothetical protein
LKKRDREIAAEIKLRFLSTDQEFRELISLVEAFADATKTPFWQHTQEVAAAMTNPNMIVVIAECEGRIVAYVCGYFMTATEFLITQAYSKRPEVTEMGMRMLEQRVKERGGKRMMCHTEHPPRLFRKFGFGLERYLLSKRLEE